MSCPSCAAAEANPRSAEFAAGCLSCEGRAMACTGTLPDDTDTMRRVWPDQQRLAQGREHFHRWAGALRRHRAKQGVAP
jgi:hypothetical protein